MLSVNRHTQGQKNVICEASKWVRVDTVSFSCWRSQASKANPRELCGASSRIFICWWGAWFLCVGVSGSDSVLEESCALYPEAGGLWSEPSHNSGTRLPSSLRPQKLPNTGHSWLVLVKLITFWLTRTALCKGSEDGIGWLEEDVIFQRLPYLLQAWSLAASRGRKTEWTWVLPLHHDSVLHLPGIF